MFKAKNIFIPLCVLFSILCLISVVDAAKGGGGCRDRDNDGYFQKAGCGSTVDCDDTDAAVNPDAVEVCDGIDNNCDGAIDEGCGGCTDNDGDGYGSGSCLGPDCDDTDPAVNPGASEVCDDSVDNNCDGTVDEGCAGCTPTANKERGCDCFDNADNDCDGSTDSLDRDCKRETCDSCFDNDGDGWYDCGNDCDDNNPAINPGATEVCNGIDDNCDGSLPIEEMDVDWDGVSICEGDCDDNNPSRSPNIEEGPFGDPTCSDALDNDCDDLIDAADPDCGAPCPDNDGDGATTCDGDCDDNDPTICPLCPLLCDGKDSNCDGRLDFPDDIDADGDGYPICAGDCDDNDPFVGGGPEGWQWSNPFGEPTCTDLMDNDCDGLTDSSDPDCAFPDVPHDMISDCTVCHDPGTYVLNALIPNSKCDQCHTPTGSLKPSYPSAPDVTTHYSNIYTDPTTGVLVNIDCVECHNPMRPQTNLAHIRSVIRGWPVVFTSYTGFNSFADGFPPFDGICEICHTQTAHHQVDGTAPGGQSHNDGTDCRACHSHPDGFNGIIYDCFGPHDNGWDCTLCHDPGTYIPNPPIHDSRCLACHDVAAPGTGLGGADTKVVTHSGSRYGSYSVNCVECHNDHCNSNNLKLVRSTIQSSIIPGSQIIFNAYSGPDSFADGPPYEENICETCHSLTNHHRYDGSTGLHNDSLNCTLCHAHLDGYSIIF